MKKIFTILLCSLALSAQAVTVSEVSGVFQGSLNIGGQVYSNKEVYVLPGTESNTITFVLPNFSYNAASLGDIVLVNIPMNNSGRLTLENRPLYIKALHERADISVLNGVQDGNTTYNSDLASSSAQVLLSIAASSVPQPIMVLFSGNKVTNRNYAITNGGFEGSWSNNELSGWHSFPTATGDFASFVTGNTDQFQRSTEKRPGSTGSQSVRLQSNIIMKAKANGNCTNGRINAGATSADSPEKNYNFSDPSSNGFNTAFVGQPDSLVFWAKYIPADNNPSNSVNQARAHVAITTNARYQDPETGNSASVKIADAAINYSATPTLGWQRLSAPFTYTSLDPSQAAYMLITFTTNKTPGGGSTYQEGGTIFGGGTNHVDNVYIDDVEMVYNHALKSFKMNGTAVNFSNGKATTDAQYSDSEHTFVAVTNGKAAKAFVGYDEANSKVHVYVVADNYAQGGSYSLYSLQMAEPAVNNNTEYSYSASTCSNEPYSDELFANLSEAGTYTTTIPNTHGGDSVITLTLTTLPAYSLADTLRLNTVDTTWHGIHIAGLPAQADPYVYRDSLKTLAGCDSVCSLVLFISDIPITYGAYEAVLCEGEQVTYEGVTYSSAYKGNILLAEKNIYGGDSIVRLTVTVYPNIETDEYLTMQEGESLTWQGWNLSSMPVGKHTLYTTYYSVYDCDSTIVLHLTVNAVPVIEGLEDAEISSGRAARKVLLNGKIYIIRKDEKIYDILGKKIQ